MRTNKIETIYSHKNSDIAVLLGSGPSINNITEDQWKAISKFDTWTMNNWIYHPFIPKFYHTEVKKYNSTIWKQRRIEKNDKLENTIFIINKHRRGFLCDLIGNKKHIFEYKMNKINTTNKGIVPNYIPDSDPNTLTCNLNSSMTIILELLYRFKYKKVIFFGVDMINSNYFWTGRSEYGKTHCQWNKDHEGKNPLEPHNSAHIKNFIIWFSENRMKEINGKFYVGHKDTLLYPNIELINIEDQK